MKYYFLHIKTDEKVGGAIIKSMSMDYDFYDDKGVYAFNRIDFPEVNELKYLILTKGAELNDILSAIMLYDTGLLINIKAKSIFTLFNLPPHKFYPAYIKDYLGNRHDYCWLQTSSKRYVDDFLNYQDSVFYLRKDRMGIIKEDIAINSLEDIDEFNKKLTSGQAIKIKTTVLKKDFANVNIDLFKIGRLSTDWIISKRLKEALQKANITGISFKEADNIFVEE